MDLRASLAKLEEMKGLMDLFFQDREKFSRDNWDRFSELYGGVEELIHRLVGVQEVEVRVLGGKPAVYKNYIEAGWLSGSAVYSHEGRTQLIKVIGKVRTLVQDPGLLTIPASISHLIRCLHRFRECCQYIETPPQNERLVQDIVWIMLRSQFDRVNREDTLPRFGVKNYRPDFGLPELNSLVEVKFIGDKTDVRTIQEEVLADLPAYLANPSEYTGVVIFVYDAAHKLRDPKKFIEDIRTIEGVVEVIVIPGMGGG